MIANARWQSQLFLATTLSLMFIMATLTLLPGNPQPGDSELIWLVAKVPPTFQNAMHLVLYAVLAFMWLLWLALTGRDSTLGKLLTVIAIIAFGTGLESMQLLIPGRYASVPDAGLNVIGTLTGTLVGRLLLPRLDTCSFGRGRE